MHSSFLGNLSSGDTDLRFYGSQPEHLSLYCVEWGVKLYSLTHSVTNDNVNVLRQ